MPELPEVQTIVNQLKDSLVEKEIVGVEVRLAKLFIGNKEQAVGKKIIDVRRRAKMIIIDLDGPLSLVVHLKMTGQLIYGTITGHSSLVTGETISCPNPIPFAGNTLPGKTTHVIFRLKDSHDNISMLFFNDMRQFGWVKVMNDAQLKEVDEKHGPEIFEKDFTPEYLEKICSKWNRPIKLLLLEQAKISGIGNIYANEALWGAKIDPRVKGKEIEKEKISELYRSIKKVLEQGIKYGGSSAADEAFVNAKGLPGKMQEHFMVYQKDGQKCSRNDGGIIERIAIGGRGTFFCPKCQK